MISVPTITATVKYREYPRHYIAQAPDPVTASYSVSNNVDEVKRVIEDAVSDYYDSACVFHVDFEQDNDVSDVGIELSMEGTTGDVENDAMMMQTIQDIVSEEIDNVFEEPVPDVSPSYLGDKELIIYTIDGEAIRALVKEKLELTDQYTFYSVQPKGQASRVAALASPDELYVEKKWNRKKPLGAASIFDPHIQWYDALTGILITGGLGNYINLDIDDVL